jgi:hypothetical protein
MELSGTVAANLRRAIDSVKRHRGKPVHRDTEQYWSALLSHAKNRRPQPRGLDRLITTLEGALADRVV